MEEKELALQYMPLAGMEGAICWQLNMLNWHLYILDLTD